MHRLIRIIEESIMLRQKIRQIRALIFAEHLINYDIILQLNNFEQVLKDLEEESRNIMDDLA